MKTPHYQFFADHIARYWFFADYLRMHLDSVESCYYEHVHYAGTLNERRGNAFLRKWHPSSERTGKLWAVLKDTDPTKNTLEDSDRLLIVALIEDMCTLQGCTPD
ncbi:MAG: hypothetical protein RIG62_03505 [Cyclobacteriaceae bacterium]